ncbi:hypothetical protein F4803DRAFT_544278 [Xylaria telfairii]|nr:hypothetical protein F4803DRAFT_544278 [Xylaria telfairii]
MRCSSWHQPAYCIFHSNRNIYTVLVPTKVRPLAHRVVWELWLKMREQLNTRRSINAAFNHRQDAKMTTQPPDTKSRSRKRRAEDSLSYSASKRCRVSKISSAPSCCPPPHPLSVNGLIRKHCRDRLYVHPLQWTTQHLGLLGYRFVRKSNSKLRNHGHQRRHQNSLQLPSEATIRATTNYLRNPSIRDFKTTIIMQFFTACNLIQLDKCHLPFNFGRETITTVPTSGVFSYRSNTASFAYLDLECVGSERNTSIGLSMSKKLDGPVWRIRRKQQRQLQPDNEAEDPYIAAVLIALAQGLQHQHQEESSNNLNECLEPVPTKLDPRVLPRQTATDFEVRLLALARDARSLYFYTASIPSRSLDMLNEPSYYYSTNVVLVSYYAIKLKACNKTVQDIKGIISSF